ncbi:MAG: acetyl-CoA carboxylase biotin carboxyl carrier protein subunit [Thermodesulfobacteriota bacterium]|nr:acetyl-CoA carboxylase biotin carboxyl carrier protein subunit [Thermodesulfobacteriota bacterium]
MGNESNGNRKVEVKAPMSGIFYRRPAPDQPSYVEIGTAVEKKQLLALLETMKVFQKIKSPVAGRVVEIIRENEAPVKDNDLLFIIEVQS